MISVIIPTLNEETHIAACIRQIRGEAPESEIIVADGGSTDKTPEIAGNAGATVILSEKGRGTQMNRGAGSARGSVLLFLHADTRLDPGWQDEIMRQLDDVTVAAGAFTFRIDDPFDGRRAVEAWVRWRSMFCRLPYGDQGLFLRKDVFKTIGGFQEIPLMEDVDIVQRLKGAGRIAVSSLGAHTSGRQWRRNGVLKTTLRNHFIMLLYRFGVSPERLYRLYYR